MAGPSFQQIISALKSLKYFDAPISTSPFYEIQSKHIIFFVSKVTGSIDTRRDFLLQLSKKLNSKKISNFYNVNKSTSPKSSIGAIEIGESKTKIVCKYPESSEQVEKISLMPKHITPSIVDKWLTPETIVKNVRQYLKDKNAPQYLQDQIDIFLKGCLSNKNETVIPGDLKTILVPAQFFEILTSVKMAVLIRNNDNKLKRILKIDGNAEFSSKSAIKINIPESATTPLFDYQISFKPDEHEETYKVSVKSKVKSDNTNTLKIDQMFDSVIEVSWWYRKLTGAFKRNQLGPAMVAYANLRYSSKSKNKQVTKKGATPASKYSGKQKIGFPIDAVGHILQVSYLNLDKVIMSNYSIIEDGKKRAPKSTEVRLLGIACRQIARKIGSIKSTNMLSDIFTKKSEAKILTVSSNFVLSNSKVAGKPAPPSLENFGIFCEKCLAAASKENSQAKFNFYRMFRTKVLKERAVCYAISNSEEIKTPKGVNTKIIYGFYSLINWKSEYEKIWIGLRSKGTDVLGLDL